MDRKAFLDQEAPAGYVAGIGRGATGFTTSADVGSASRIVPDNDYEDDDDDDGPKNEEEIDERGLLVRGGVDNDDDEADKIYDEVERRLSHKSKKDKENSDAQPSVTSAFADLKRALSSVSEDQWANLPEVGDLTKRNKRLRLLEKSQQRFYAVPDTLLVGGSNGGAGESTDFNSISKTKDKLLSKQLDSVVGNTGEGLTNQIDENDFIIDQTTDNKIDDIRKGRLIFSSLRKTEPLNPNSWIASAKLEEQDRKFSTAKSLIENGCQKIPRSVSLWLENIRLHHSDGTKHCKLICGQALKFNPKSEQLWLKAVDLEHPSDFLSQRRILMKALESVPDSVGIWKKLIELEGEESKEEDIKKLLSKAVEFCPKEWDFWLSLINLSEYSEAKSIINRARKIMNDNYKIWITAAKLEERENEDISEAKLSRLMSKGVDELKKHTVDKSKLLSKEDWLHEATIAEGEGFLLTCKAIVKIALQTEEEDEFNIDPSSSRVDDWLSLADGFSKFTETSNNIFQIIISKYPTKIDVWLKLLDSFKKTKNEKPDPRLFEYYEQMVKINEDEIFYLMYAKDLWKLNTDIDKAKEVLERAGTLFPFSESVWFARIKFAKYTSGTSWVEESLAVSTKMFQRISDNSSAAWYKHIHLLRCSYSKNGKPVDEYLTTLCDEALDKFPDCGKLYLQKSQILQDVDTLAVGVRRCAQFIPLWINYAHAVKSNPVRARAILDNSITQNPSSPLLWVERIRFEKQLNNFDSARQLCTKALQKFPSDANLWIENLHLISKISQRKNAFMDSLKKTNNSSIILMNIGLFFWIDGKFTKVKAWFERALNSDEGKLNGDCWGWMFKYFGLYGTEDEMNEFLQKFSDVYDEINAGETWTKLSKSINRDRFDRPVEFLGEVSNSLVSNTPMLELKR
ncbi:pre-mRNA-splicing factor 6 [[Candida] railenensis]|uniref:Pre-mRNA-splicing factor 6 n=1 Tax=[Candida] railenensis TaxID=45579 RepID=A0A9P0QWC4_9ASCO|nr:pre-mRNA-splicing factor 6 [[Candida] railenensis]